MKIFLSLLLSFFLLPLAANPSPSPSINYEVKFLLQPAKILQADNSVKPEVLAQLKLTDAKTEQFRVGYIDSDARSLGAAGWSMRLRKRADQQAHRLQYKKRYPLQANEQHEVLDAAISQARADGFDIADPAFKVEIDWGLHRQTLSFAYTTTPNFALADALAMPSPESVLPLLPELAPKAMPPQLLTKAPLQIYGYVPFDRYSKKSVKLAKQQFNELTLEVWHYPASEQQAGFNLVELSFAATGSAQASALRQSMLQQLTEWGWLAEQQQLKTQLTITHFSL
ncbi:CYTH domain-containing protein [Arsukibacterium sp.]|uniref:CYTH domain-containing protein n=1 Tax=Arsukibacterium sp. TaxID=1977258 RepID=UPI002FD9B107